MECFVSTGLRWAGMLCVAAVYAAAAPDGATLSGDPPIRVDQAGYLPALPKVAIVVQPSSDHVAATFALHRSKNKSVVMTFKLSAPVIDKDSGDAVQYADFSNVNDSADGLAEPWPGMLSGGPNPGRQDAAMKRSVSADTKPARAYSDETAAYACNEIAINWNAPLVFTLAAAVAAP